jgi:Domain of unknown function (DUF4349)
MRPGPFPRATALLLALTAALAACSPPPLPPDVAPPRASTPAPVYQNGKPAPDVQPEPTSTLVRDGRAETILAYIGSIEGRVGRAEEDARIHAQGRPDACLARVLVELGTVARQARERRSQLRDAAFEDPAEEDRLFHELTGFATHAHQLAEQCQQLAVYRQGDDYKMRVRELEGRIGKLTPLPGGQSSMQSYALESMVVSGQLSSAPGVRISSAASSIKRSFAGFFSGGGGAKTGASAPPAPLPPAAPTPAGPPVAAPAGSAFGQGAHDVSMLLRSAQLTLAVYEVEKKMDAVQATAVELGGYLALRGDRELTVRVPRERFDEALRRIEGVGDVLHRSVAAEDVTDQFVDLELRLKNALAVRARLEKLLESASVKDAVEIQKELAKITEEVERFEGKLKLLRDRIAYSTITVTFERTEPQRVRSQALLPFAWMRTMGLVPLLQVTR